MPTPIQCRECGRPLAAARHPDARFCARACAKRFYDRRSLRGAELYDFVMSQRFTRQHEGEAFNVVCALASGYREQDIRARDGRPSWLAFEDALAKLKRLPGTPDTR